MAHYLTVIMKINCTIAFILFLTVALVCADSPENKKQDFQLSALEGNWEGVGEAVIPMTSIPISLEGEANF